MAHDTLKHAMIKTIGSSTDYQQTFRQYRRDIEKFAKWAKEAHKIRLADQVTDPASRIMEYSEHLQGQGLSANTVHRYLAPVCKGLNIPMDQIKKPKRAAETVTKTRNPLKNKRGQKDMKREENARIVSAARAIGIRKEELYALRGRDLTRDEQGYICVHVAKGKGGKEQYQRILEKDAGTVREIFKGVPENGRVFSPHEIKSSAKIPIHRLRAEHAREAYEYYVRICADQAGREQIRRELLRTFQEHHPEGKKQRRQERFLELMDKSGGVYRLRGENREIFEREGRPAEYDRVALMAVSVWHLAHWRLDVTARHYMR